MCSRDPQSCYVMFVCWILNLCHIARIFEDIVDPDPEGDQDSYAGLYLKL